MPFIPSGTTDRYGQKPALGLGLKLVKKWYIETGTSGGICKRLQPGMKTGIDEKLRKAQMTDIV